MWDLCFLPFLFALIGLLLDFSVFTWELLDTSLALIAIGVGARVLVVLLITLCTNLNCKEKLFVSICFLPKATVQAALAPVLAHYCLVHAGKDYAQLTLQTCILAIMLSAPVGQVLLS